MSLKNKKVQTVLLPFTNAAFCQIGTIHEETGIASQDKNAIQMLEAATEIASLYDEECQEERIPVSACSTTQTDLPAMQDLLSEVSEEYEVAEEGQTPQSSKGVMARQKRDGERVMIDASLFYDDLEGNSIMTIDEFLFHDKEREFTEKVVGAGHGIDSTVNEFLHHTISSCEQAVSNYPDVYFTEEGIQVENMEITSLSDFECQTEMAAVTKFIDKSTVTSSVLSHCKKMQVALLPAMNSAFCQIGTIQEHVSIVSEERYAIQLLEAATEIASLYDEECQDERVVCTKNTITQTDTALLYIEEKEEKSSSGKGVLARPKNTNEAEQFNKCVQVILPLSDQDAMCAVITLNNDACIQVEDSLYFAEDAINTRTQERRSIALVDKLFFVEENTEVTQQQYVEASSMHEINYKSETILSNELIDKPLESSSHNKKMQVIIWPDLISVYCQVGTFHEDVCILSHDNYVEKQLQIDAEITSLYDEECQEERVLLPICSTTQTDLPEENEDVLFCKTAVREKKGRQKSSSESSLGSVNEDGTIPQITKEVRTKPKQDSRRVLIDASLFYDEVIKEINQYNKNVQVAVVPDELDAACGIGILYNDVSVQIDEELVRSKFIERAIGLVEPSEFTVSAYLHHSVLLSDKEVLFTAPIVRHEESVQVDLKREFVERVIGAGHTDSNQTVSALLHHSIPFHEKGMVHYPESFQSEESVQVESHIDYVEVSNIREDNISNHCSIGLQTHSQADGMDAACEISTFVNHDFVQTEHSLSVYDESTQSEQTIIKQREAQSQVFVLEENQSVKTLKSPSELIDKYCEDISEEKLSKKIQFVSGKSNQDFQMQMCIDLFTTNKMTEERVDHFDEACSTSLCKTMLDEGLEFEEEVRVAPTEISHIQVSPVTTNQGQQMELSALKDLFCMDETAIKKVTESSHEFGVKMDTKKTLYSEAKASHQDFQTQVCFVKAEREAFEEACQTSLADLSETESISSQKAARLSLVACFSDYDSLPHKTMIESAAEPISHSVDNVTQSDNVVPIDQEFMSFETGKKGHLVDCQTESDSKFISSYIEPINIETQTQVQTRNVKLQKGHPSGSHPSQSFQAMPEATDKEVQFLDEVPEELMTMDTSVLTRTETKPETHYDVETLTDEIDLEKLLREVFLQRQKELQVTQETQFSTDVAQSTDRFVQSEAKRFLLDHQIDSQRMFHTTKDSQTETKDVFNEKAIQQGEIDLVTAKVETFKLQMESQFSSYTHHEETKSVDAPLHSLVDREGSESSIKLLQSSCQTDGVVQINESLQVTSPRLVDEMAAAVSMEYIHQEAQHVQEAKKESGLKTVRTAVELQMREFSTQIEISKQLDEMVQYTTVGLTDTHMEGTTIQYTQRSIQSHEEIDEHKFVQTEDMTITTSDFLMQTDTGQSIDEELQSVPLRLVDNFMEAGISRIISQETQFSPSRLIDEIIESQERFPLQSARVEVIHDYTNVSIQTQSVNYFDSAVQCVTEPGVVMFDEMIQATDVVMTNTNEFSTQVDYSREITNSVQYYARSSNDNIQQVEQLPVRTLSIQYDVPTLSDKSVSLTNVGNQWFANNLVDQESRHTECLLNAECSTENFKCFDKCLQVKPMNHDRNEGTIWENQLIDQIVQYEPDYRGEEIQSDTEVFEEQTAKKASKQKSIALRHNEVEDAECQVTVATRGKKMQVFVYGEDQAVLVDLVDEDERWTIMDQFSELTETVRHQNMLASVPLETLSTQTPVVHLLTATIDSTRPCGKDVSSGPDFSEEYESEADHQKLSHSKSLETLSTQTSTVHLLTASTVCRGTARREVSSGPDFIEEWDCAVQHSLELRDTYSESLDYRSTDSELTLHPTIIDRLNIPYTPRDLTEESGIQTMRSTLVDEFTDNSVTDRSIPSQTAEFLCRNISTDVEMNPRMTIDSAIASLDFPNAGETCQSRGIVTSPMTIEVLLTLLRSQTEYFEIMKEKAVQVHKTIELEDDFHQYQQQAVDSTVDAEPWTQVKEERSTQSERKQALLDAEEHSNVALISKEMQVSQDVSASFTQTEHISEPIIKHSDTFEQLYQGTSSSSQQNKTSNTEFTLTLTQGTCTDFSSELLDLYIEHTIEKHAASVVMQSEAKEDQQNSLTQTEMRLKNVGILCDVQPTLQNMSTQTVQDVVDKTMLGKLKQEDQFTSCEKQGLFDMGVQSEIMTSKQLIDMECSIDKIAKRNIGIQKGYPKLSEQVTSCYIQTDIWHEVTSATQQTVSPLQVNVSLQHTPNSVMLPSTFSQTEPISPQTSNFGLTYKETSPELINRSVDVFVGSASIGTQFFLEKCAHKENSVNTDRHLLYDTFLTTENLDSDEEVEAIEDVMTARKLATEKALPSSKRDQYVEAFIPVFEDVCWEDTVTSVHKTVQQSKKMRDQPDISSLVVESQDALTATETERMTVAGISSTMDFEDQTVETESCFMKDSWMHEFVDIMSVGVQHVSRISSQDEATDVILPHLKEDEITQTTSIELHHKEVQLHPTILDEKIITSVMPSQTTSSELCEATFTADVATVTEHMEATQSTQISFHDSEFSRTIGCEAVGELMDDWYISKKQAKSLEKPKKESIDTFTETQNVLINQAMNSSQEITVKHVGIHPDITVQDAESETIVKPTKCSQNAFQICSKSCGSDNKVDQADTGVQSVKCQLKDKALFEETCMLQNIIIGTEDVPQCHKSTVSDRITVHETQALFESSNRHIGVGNMNKKLRDHFSDAEVDGNSMSTMFEASSGLVDTQTSVQIGTRNAAISHVERLTKDIFSYSSVDKVMNKLIGTDKCKAFDEGTDAVAVTLCNTQSSFTIGTSGISSQNLIPEQHDIECELISEIQRTTHDVSQNFTTSPTIYNRYSEWNVEQRTKPLDKIDCTIEQAYSSFEVDQYHVVVSTEVPQLMDRGTDINSSPIINSDSCFSLHTHVQSVNVNPIRIEHRGIHSTTEQQDEQQDTSSMQKYISIAVDTQSLRCVETKLVIHEVETQDAMNISIQNVIKTRNEYSEFSSPVELCHRLEERPPRMAWMRESTMQTDASIFDELIAEVVTKMRQQQTLSMRNTQSTFTSVVEDSECQSEKPLSNVHVSAWNTPKMVDSTEQNDVVCYSSMSSQTSPSSIITVALEGEIVSCRNAGVGTIDESSEEHFERKVEQKLQSVRQNFMHEVVQTERLIHKEAGIQVTRPYAVIETQTITSPIVDDMVVREIGNNSLALQFSNEAFDITTVSHRLQTLVKDTVSTSMGHSPSTREQGVIVTVDVTDSALVVETIQQIVEKCVESPKQTRYSNSIASNTSEDLMEAYFDIKMKEVRDLIPVEHESVQTPHVLTRDEIVECEQLLDVMDESVQSQIKSLCKDKIIQAGTSHHQIDVICETNQLYEDEMCQTEYWIVDDALECVSNNVTYKNVWDSLASHSFGFHVGTQIGYDVFDEIIQCNLISTAQPDSQQQVMDSSMYVALHQMEAVTQTEQCPLKNRENLVFNEITSSTRSSQNDIITPHLLNRDEAFTLRNFNIGTQSEDIKLISQCCQFSHDIEFVDEPLEMSKQSSLQQSVKKGRASSSTITIQFTTDLADAASNTTEDEIHLMDQTIQTELVPALDQQAMFSGLNFENISAALQTDKEFVREKWQAWVVHEFDAGCDATISLVDRGTFTESEEQLRRSRDTQTSKVSSFDGAVQQTPLVHSESLQFEQDDAIYPAQTLLLQTSNRILAFRPSIMEISTQTDDDMGNKYVSLTTSYKETRHHYVGSPYTPLPSPHSVGVTLATQTENNMVDHKVESRMTDENETLSKTQMLSVETVDAYIQATNHQHLFDFLIKQIGAERIQVSLRDYLILDEADVQTDLSMTVETRTQYPANKRDEAVSTAEIPLLDICEDEVIEELSSYSILFAGQATSPTGFSRQRPPSVASSGRSSGLMPKRPPHKHKRIQRGTSSINLCSVGSDPIFEWIPAAEELHITVTETLSEESTFRRHDISKEGDKTFKTEEIEQRFVFEASEDPYPWPSSHVATDAPVRVQHATNKTIQTDFGGPVVYVGEQFQRFLVSNPVLCLPEDPVYLNVLRGIRLREMTVECVYHQGEHISPEEAIYHNYLSTRYYDEATGQYVPLQEALRRNLVKKAADDYDDKLLAWNVKQDACYELLEVFNEMTQEFVSPHQAIEEGIINLNEGVYISSSSLLDEEKVIDLKEAIHQGLIHAKTKELSELPANIPTITIDIPLN